MNRNKWIVTNSRKQTSLIELWYHLFQKHRGMLQNSDIGCKCCWERNLGNLRWTNQVLVKHHLGRPSQIPIFFESSFVVAKGEGSSPCTTGRWWVVDGPPRAGCRCGRGVIGWTDPTPQQEQQYQHCAFFLSSSLDFTYTDNFKVKRWGALKPCCQLISSVSFSNCWRMLL